MTYKDIIFPSSHIIEQASSQATALYKASLIEADTFVDLTCGAAVDSWAFAQHATHGDCIERDETAAQIAQHNLDILKPDSCELHNMKAEEFIKTMPDVDLAYIDPARRDDARKGKYKLEDCSPDILGLLDSLLPKTKTLMIKTSPMLDIAQAIQQLQTVQAVHIVEYKGDCKELVFILGNTANPNPQIIPVIINSDGTPLHKMVFTPDQEVQTDHNFSAPLKYLFEPSPAFQKSGGFHMISKTYGLKKLHPHTHLYTSGQKPKNLPGRIFEIIGQYPAKSKKIPIKQANITVRNFPETVESLRKKLKMKDGGAEYLFACTLLENQKILLHARKP